LAAVDPLIIAGAVLVLLGVLASKTSTRLGIPAVLLFLVLGMAAGSEGIGGIEFEDFGTAQTVGIVALAFILFSGGLDTEWTAVRPVLVRGLVMGTAGVAITAVVVGLVAVVVLELPLAAGLLLGAIISSTDAAAVFSVLRSRSVGLRDELRPLLEFESGSNDPMAVFLTIGFLEILTSAGTEPVALVPLFAQQMAVGGAVGYAFARGMIVAINRLRIEYDGLYPVLTTAAVLLTYGATAALGGSGVLAVYVAGLVVGGSPLIHKSSLMRFHDAIAWLMQIAMFLVLGLLVNPSELVPIAGRAMLLSAVLIFVARPVATYLGLVRSGMGARAKALVSWVGLRGAVPIILATFPLVEGIDQADTIFNVVFFIVLTSVLVQGTTIPVVARWLGVDAPMRPTRPYPLELGAPADGSTGLHEIEIPERSPIIGRRLVDLGLPKGTLVVLISRDDAFVVPQGATVLQPADKILLLADSDGLGRAQVIVEGRR
jgi:potassium/hydrogen antiporter